MINKPKEQEEEQEQEQANILTQVVVAKGSANKFDDQLKGIVQGVRRRMNK